MNYLVVVAHPDDETLGAGGTIRKLVLQGHNVDVAILCESVSARKNKSDSLSLDEKKALEILGVKNVFKGNFPNIKMNTVAHLDLVQFVEKCIIDSKAQAIITHHPADTNDDHIQTSHAVQAACRLFQRRDDVLPLHLLLYMEVPSSTEWSFDSSSNRFTPNYFVEIGLEGLQEKIHAINAYKGVMRKYPHPRSEEAVKALAAFRGVQAGLNYAEAFDCVFKRE